MIKIKEKSKHQQPHPRRSAKQQQPYALPALSVSLSLSLFRTLPLVLLSNWQRWILFVWQPQNGSLREWERERERTRQALCSITTTTTKTSCKRQNKREETVKAVGHCSGAAGGNAQKQLKLPQDTAGNTHKHTGRRTQQTNTHIQKVRNAKTGLDATADATAVPKEVGTKWRK